MYFMGSEMLTNSQDSNSPASAPVVRQACTPAELADVALIAARGCAATGDMSISQWYSLVRDRIAPQPVIRRSRYTRWSLSEVRNFFMEFANQKRGDRDQCVVMARARKASAASKAKRRLTLPQSVPILDQDSHDTEGGPAQHQDCRHGQAAGQ